MTGKRGTIFTATENKKTNRRIVKVIKIFSVFSAIAFFTGSLISCVVVGWRPAVFFLILFGFCFLLVPLLLPTILRLDD
ncbi:hypothetical protein ACFL38_02670 [Candidatus Omnitrophota bacterium]